MFWSCNKAIPDSEPNQYYAYLLFFGCTYTLSCSYWYIDIYTYIYLVQQIRRREFIYCVFYMDTIICSVTKEQCGMYPVRMAVMWIIAKGPGQRSCLPIVLPYLLRNQHPTRYFQLYCISGDDPVPWTYCRFCSCICICSCTCINNRSNDTTNQQNNIIMSKSKSTVADPAKPHRLVWMMHVL